MKKIKETLTNNLQWKILALFISVVFWFVIMNIKDPVTTKSITVNLQLMNLESLESTSRVLENEGALRNIKVTVKISGKTSDLNALQNNNVIAFIDFNLIELKYFSPQEQSATTTISVKFDDGVQADKFSIVSKSPDKADVYIDKVISEKKAVTWAFTGKVTEGYEAGTPVMSPEEVWVSGTQSKLGRIKTIQAEVDLNGATNNIETAATLRIFDEENNEITGGDYLSIDTVTIKVPIYKIFRIPIVRPEIIGTPADGFAISGMKLSSDYVSIINKGLAEDLISRISIDPIDAEGKSETFTVTYDLRDYLSGSKIHTASGSVTEVEATVTIEPIIEKQFEISVASVDIEGITEFTEIQNESIRFTIKGRAGIIENISVENIQASAMLTDLAPGTYDIPVELKLPPETTIAGESPVLAVTVSEPPEAVESTEPPAAAGV